MATSNLSWLMQYIARIREDPCLRNRTSRRRSEVSPPGSRKPRCARCIANWRAPGDGNIGGRRRRRFEVIVGAILTQNTSWTNVERALASLRAAGKLSVAGIRQVPLPKLEQLIRSSGYFRQKAQRLKNFVAFLDARYDGSLQRMFATPTEQLRDELLALNGIGPETADSILLYAGNHSIFVVDAYTRRILERHECGERGREV